MWKVDKLMQLERSAGTDSYYLHTLPQKLHFLLSLEGIVATSIKKLASHLLSPLQPMPVVEYSVQSWSEKNSGILCQQLLLTSTAYGLQSSVMEGLDSRRLKYALKVPAEVYSVPMIVCLGYGETERDKQTEADRDRQKEIDRETDMKETEELASYFSEQTTEKDLGRKQTPRFPLREMVFKEEYGKPLF